MDAPEATEFLGAPPVGGLLAYASFVRPALVALSVTTADAIPAARELESELLALPRAPSVVLGGAALFGASVSLLTE